MQLVVTLLDAVSVHTSSGIRICKNLHNFLTSQHWYRYLYDGMEEANSKDDLPPGTSQDVLLEVASGDLREGPPHVGPQAFGRLVGHLATNGRQSVTRNAQKAVKLKRGMQPIWRSYRCASETYVYSCDLLSTSQSHKAHVTTTSQYNVSIMTL